MEHYKNLSLENITETIDGVEHVEKWKPVIGYEGLYEVSDFGRVKALFKTRPIGNSHNRIYLLKVMKQKIGNWGYTQVTLCKEGKRKWPYVHRLIAIAFIINPDNKKTVNHINGIKTNNKVTNLEWNTPIENMKHASYNGLHKNYNIIQNNPIIQLSIEGEFIREWKSAAEANRELRLKKSGLRSCLYNRIKSFNGYIWKYKN